MEELKNHPNKIINTYVFLVYGKIFEVVELANDIMLKVGYYGNGEKYLSVISKSEFENFNANNRLK